MPESKASAPPSQATWLTYRPDIKVVDCTIRDGGLMNDHQFTDDFVGQVYRACVEAGIDYMEVGYKASRRVFSMSEHGKWKFCLEDDLRRILEGDPGDTRISVMADAERTDYHEDILPKKDSVISQVRVACYINQLATALDMVKDAHDKGYETCLNIMAVTTVPAKELEEALEIACQSEVGTLYVVDSFGSLYSEPIQALCNKFKKYTVPAGKRFGIHAHDNQELAFANTIEAIVCGASMADASMAGLGRGSGNCRMELLLSFLHNPKFHLRPVLKCVQEHVEPMRKDLRWGFAIPYMLTGVLNQHPRTAIAFNEGAEANNVVKFYDTMGDKE